MLVTVDGNPVNLDKRMVLGSGGEGTVYKVKINGDIVALKVYEKPTKERSSKLLAFDKFPHKFSDRIIAPKEMAFDQTGLAVGFSMPIIGGTFSEIAKLSNKKYRTNYGVTTRDVAVVFLDGIPTLNNIHNQGFVVGDFNDLNVLTQNQKMIWWDVDSWQFGKFPCPVATETFLDPMLYGIDLSVRPVFTAGNDWYSFAVMLFKSLLLVHPFGGIHKTFNGLLERAKKKVTVFDKNVTYPVIAISPDVLTDDLHNVFDGYFSKGTRIPFPEAKLRDYLDCLRECTKCGTYFPSNRGSCPVCSAKMIVLIQKPITSSKGIEVIEMVRVNGHILYTRAVGEDIRILAYEKGMVVLYIKKPDLPASRRELFTHVPGSRFEMSREHVYVNIPGTDEILVYEASTAKLLGKLTTGTFASTRVSIFRATDDYLLRIDGSELKYGRMQNGKLEESGLRRIMEDQTWFWADSSSENPYVFGLFQVVRQQVYWMIKDGNFFDVAVPQLESGEVVLEVTAKFSSLGVFLLRKTQVAGKNYLRREMIDSLGRVTFSNKLEESSHPNPVVHGQAYATGIVLHPTDKGVMQERLESGQTKVFPGTLGYVDGGDTLIRFGGSLLAVKQDRVLQITLR